MLCRSSSIVKFIDQHKPVLHNFIWYGWLTDAVLVAIICVFTPIAPLRAILNGFFQIIMFNSNAVLHIGICLFLGAALSLIGLAVLKRKTL